MKSGARYQLSNKTTLNGNVPNRRFHEFARQLDFGVKVLFEGLERRVLLKHRNVSIGLRQLVTEFTEVAAPCRSLI